MKKKLAWICLLASPLVFGAVVFFLLPRDAITQGNCGRIKRGMSEKEVEAILGRKKDGELVLDGSFTADQTFDCWEGSRGTIIVVMDIGDLTLVYNARFLPSEPRTFLEKFRNWLGM